MKVKRYKRVQRYLNFYKASFGLVKPYRILMDGTFALGALENKINIQEQLMKYLGEDLIIRKTDCVMTELRALGPAGNGPSLILEKFDTEKCSHKKRKPPGKCFMDIITKNSDKRFFVATQDRELTEALREIPGTPVLFVNYNTILLERPPQLSLEKAEADSRAKLEVQNSELETLKELKRKILGIDPAAPPLKKKRKQKGANPLSCKKKKKKSGLQGEVLKHPESQKKRRRKRTQTKINDES